MPPAPPANTATPRRDALVAELRASRDRVAAFYRALPPTALDVRVYDDGARWTAKQVLAHLITIERTMPLLWKAILAGTSAASSAEFDLERFNRAQPAKLDPLTVDELLARFDDVRAASIERVEALDEADLDRVGVHPFLGEGTMERFVAWAWVHADGHLADVRGAVQRAATAVG
ncbi:MAG: DinB family protein [Anaerolineae bacterium]